MSTIDSYTSSSDLLVETLEAGDPVAQDGLEVDVATHRGLGDHGHLVLQAGVRGQHLDDLALDEGGVHVEDDQAHAVAAQVGRLDGDVEALGGRLHRRATERSVAVSAPDTCRSIAVTG